MSTVEINIDTRIYPLDIVSAAVNTLDEGIDVSLDPVSDTEVTVSLSQSRSNDDGAEIRRSLHRALIAARVAAQAFQRAHPIRTYLAQTAFSITSQNQQTIEEFTAGLVREREQEHAGAATADPAGRLAAKQEAETGAGNQWRVDEQSGDVVVSIDTSRHVLPEVLWAAYEMGSTCPCSVTNLAGNQVSVVIEAAGKPPEQLAATFEQWLVKASEHLQ